MRNTEVGGLYLECKFPHHIIRDAGLLLLSSGLPLVHDSHHDEISFIIQMTVGAPATSLRFQARIAKNRPSKELVLLLTGKPLHHFCLYFNVNSGLKGTWKHSLRAIMSSSSQSLPQVLEFSNQDSNEQACICPNSLVHCCKIERRLQSAEVQPRKCITTQKGYLLKSAVFNLAFFNLKKKKINWPSLTEPASI